MKPIYMFAMKDYENASKIFCMDYAPKGIVVVISNDPSY